MRGVWEERGAKDANDLARELRYRVFDRPLFEAARDESFKAVEQAMHRLVRSEGLSTREADMELVVDWPHPMLAILSKSPSWRP